MINHQSNNCPTNNKDVCSLHYSNDVPTLLSLNELEQALNILRQQLEFSFFENHLILLASRLFRLKHKEEMGLLLYTDAQIERQQIKRGMLELVKKGQL